MVNTLKSSYNYNMTAKNNTLDVQQKLIDSLKNYFGRSSDIELAILFGSLAAGQFSRESDLDIAIKKKKILSLQEKQQLIEELAQLTGRAVDLVDLTIAGEPILGQIVNKGLRLYGTDAAYTRLALNHLYAQSDFVPYIKRTLKERREQWINS